MTNDDPVTVWLAKWVAGDPAAVRPLWDRYFHRLVALARERLRDCPRRAADEDDMALSAFDSFFVKAREGRFPDLTDRYSLWRLLATFTGRKVSHHVRHEAARPCGSGELGEVLGREPDPALAMEVAEECERLLAVLNDPVLRRVVLLRVDGHTVDEIAERIGRAHKSVHRKLRLIRKIWKREGGDGAE